MTYWEKANHSWTADSTRFILTPKQKSRDLFYYIQEIGYFKANKPYFTKRENLPFLFDEIYLVWFWGAALSRRGLHSKSGGYFFH